MPPRPDRPRRPQTGGRPGGAGGSGKPRPAGGGGRDEQRPSRGKPAGGTGKPGARRRPTDERRDERERPGRPGRPSGSTGRRRPTEDQLDERDGRSTRPSRPQRSGRPSSGRDRTPREERRAAKPEGRAGSWGGLARRGASSGGSSAPVVRGRLADAEPSRAAEAFRAARDDEETPRVRYERVDDVREAASGAVRRGARPERTSSRPSGSKGKFDAERLAGELAPAVGASTAPRLAARLADAGRAFDAERYTEAKRVLGPLADRAPGSAAVRELYGLTLYRLGRWNDAIRELEAFRSITGSAEQHPVLADCYRALGRYDEVEGLWLELRQVSPSADLVAEGRIVHAGSLADRGLVREAIAEIEPAVRRIRRPQDHHLRLLYVLGDLYERAGDLPRARTIFERVVAADPDFADAAARRRAL